MQATVSRRTLLAAALSLPLLAEDAPAAMAAATPLLTRIRIATFTAPDLAATERLYTRWLGYAVRGRDTVSPALAAAWGAPRTAGRRMLTMASPGAPDVPIRAVEGDRVPGYRALTTFGWNAIEIIVDDVDTLGRQLAGSPFAILDTPRPLPRYPTIKAMQVKGPSEEVLYLTMESGDRANSLLPRPEAFVGRPFIAVLAGGDSAPLMDWYAARFAMTPGAVAQSTTRILQAAQGRGPDFRFPTGISRLARHGNLIQFDGYPPPAGPRPRAPGQLPPGVAMHSFGVADLDALALPYLTPPATHASPGYDGRRAASLVGPAGELIELIED